MYQNIKAIRTVKRVFKNNFDIEDILVRSGLIREPKLQEYLEQIEKIDEDLFDSILIFRKRFPTIRKALEFVLNLYGHLSFEISGKITRLDERGVALTIPIWFAKDGYTIALDADTSAIPPEKWAKYIPTEIKVVRPKKNKTFFEKIFGIEDVRLYQECPDGQMLFHTHPITLKNKQWANMPSACDLGVYLKEGDFERMTRTIITPRYIIDLRCVDYERRQYIFSKFTRLIPTYCRMVGISVDTFHNSSNHTQRFIHNMIVDLLKHSSFDHYAIDNFDVVIEELFGFKVDVVNRSFKKIKPRIKPLKKFTIFDRPKKGSYVLPPDEDYIPPSPRPKRNNRDMQELIDWYMNS